MQAFGDNPFLFFGLLVPVLLTALVLFAAYWVVRLAVRHGMRDAERRRPAPPSGDPRDSRT